MRTDRAFTYLTGRSTYANLSLPNREMIETRIATDGTFTGFSPFYEYDAATQKWVTDETGWTWAAKTTRNLTYGQTVEEQDPLKRYSSVLMGYQHQLPIAVVGNARYSEAGYAHFEETGELETSCEDHLLLQRNGSNLDFSSAYAHSGKRSSRLQPGDVMTLTAPLNLTSDCDGVSTASSLCPSGLRLCRRI